MKRTESSTISIGGTTAPPTQLGLALPDEAATAGLGARLAPLLRPGDVVCLAGGLGAGKTTLARAIVGAAMGAPVEVPSPTFTLVQVYETPRLLLWHFDLYRLASPAEVLELGWEEAREEAAILVEWPERLGPLLPEGRLEIRLDLAGTGRLAHLAAFGDWTRRLTHL
jgi:tRNA threonylcarbamoyladenosine biosynthesis protein TsaE